MPNRTIWEEGHHPGRLVARAAALAMVTVALIHVAFDAQLGLVFDLVFVAVCIAAALWVHPRDFFVVGVLPPLLLAGIVLMLVVVDRDAVARSDDGFLQAFVSGLAHHSLALALGYALTLGILALRQVALRNRGSLRRNHHPAPAGTTDAEPQATTDSEATGPVAVPPTVPAQSRTEQVPAADDATTVMPSQRDALAP